MNSSVHLEETTVNPLEESHMFARSTYLSLLGIDLLCRSHLDVMHVGLHLSKFRVFHCVQFIQEIIEEPTLPRYLLNFGEEVVKDLLVLGGGEC